MRTVYTDENYIEITNKISKYLSSDDNGIQRYLELTGNIIDELDDMERIANTIPDEKYRNSLLNNISMTRNLMIQNVDIIDDIQNI
jgi:hypothetical protein